MKRLDKLVKILMILFLIGLAFILVSMWKGDMLGEKLTNIFMIYFIIVLFLFLITGLILSFNSMYEYFKKDKVAFIKTLLLRLGFLLIMSFGIDYIKGKEIDIGYGLYYSISLTIGSFYIQDKYWE